MPRPATGDFLVYIGLVDVFSSQTLFINTCVCLCEGNRIVIVPVCQHMWTASACDLNIQREYLLLYELYCEHYFVENG